MSYKEKFIYIATLGGLLLVVFNFISEKYFSFKISKLLKTIDKVKDKTKKKQEEANSLGELSKTTEKKSAESYKEYKDKVESLDKKYIEAKEKLDDQQEDLFNVIHQAEKNKDSKKLKNIQNTLIDKLKDL